MPNWTRIIEKQIQKAIEAGEFEDLPGKGKPLTLEVNPYADPGWRLAHHLLRENDFSLPWLELRKEIETELSNARGDLQNASAWRTEKIAAGGSANLVEVEWARALGTFRERIEKLNRQIFEYNLQAPSTRFHLLPLDENKERSKIIKCLGLVKPVQDT